MFFSSSEISFDSSCLRDLNHRLTIAFEGKCNVLVVGKTEYEARKYCTCYFKANNLSPYILHASSSSSIDWLVGGYSIDPSTNRLQFINSGLIAAVQNGGYCLLQQIQLMKYIQ